MRGKGSGHVDDLRVKKYRFGDLLLGLAGEAGPRIMFLARAGSPGKNMFAVLPSAGVETPEGFWRIMGGHRLWTSPEEMPRSYSLDRGPVSIEEGSGYVRLSAPAEEKNSVRKELEIRENGRGADVIHRIENTGRWPFRAACWALSVMAPGGFAAVPLKPRAPGGLLPDRRVALWPYSSLSDPRVSFEADAVFIRHEPGFPAPVKLGVSASPSRAGYFLGGSAFIKSFVREDGEYPDYGCDAEVYSCGEFLELETLGPLKLLRPGCRMEHRETWSVLDYGPGVISAEEAGEILTRPGGSGS